MGKNKKEDYNKGIEVTNILNACTAFMQLFGANNNLMRHLPELYDGLKPVERRILISMYELKLSHKSPFVKVTSIVGKTIAIHPHGEAAIGQTLARMAQPWNCVKCLIEGNGNFGSPAGDPPASSRYIEARLSFYAYKCFFEEYDPSIVDMMDGPKGEKIPEVLPSRYPNVLINDAFGIGYGISTSIPTYNFKEVLETTIELIKNPSIKSVKLYPDFSTGASIIDEGQFEEISRTGVGSFKMRGVIDIDAEENALHVRSTPYQVYWNTIKKDIFKILVDGKTNLMRAFKDESTIDNIHYIIYLKKEVDPVEIRRKMYEKTQMEKTIPVRFRLIEDREDGEYNIISILKIWIDYRRETKRNLYNRKLVKIKERQHILEILLFILNKNNAEKTITLIKESNNKSEIIEKLRKAYGISTLQAGTIAEMRLVAFSKEAYKGYVKEKEDVDKTAIELEKILRSTKKIDKIIIDELKEGIKLFGEDRRSQIITIDNEPKVRNTVHKLVITKNGFIKKLPEDITSVGKITQGDSPVDIIRCNNIDELMIFDTSGKISKVPVYGISNSSLSSEGNKISEYCNLTGSVAAIKVKPTEDSLKEIGDDVDIHLITVTKNGIIKKTSIDNYINIKNELLGLILRPGDELVSVKLCVNNPDLIIYTKHGLGVRIDTGDIKDTKRMSIGVKAIELPDNDEVIGSEIIDSKINKDKYIFIVTEKGNVKKCTLKNFSRMDRASKPLTLITLDKEDGINTLKTVNGKETFAVYLRDSIREVSIKNDVKELQRLSKGIKKIPVRKGDNIINIINVNQLKK